jgi:hypothetical protein
VVSDGSQGEDVEVLAAFGALRLRRKVSRGGVLEEAPDMLGGCDGNAGRGRDAKADLPVENLDLGTFGVRPDYQNAVWRQGTMDDALGVGVADGLGELAE